MVWDAKGKSPSGTQVCRSNPNLSGRREREGEREREARGSYWPCQEGGGRRTRLYRGTVCSIYIRTVWERSFEDTQKVFGNWRVGDIHSSHLVLLLPFCFVGGNIKIKKCWFEITFFLHVTPEQLTNCCAEKNCELGKRNCFQTLYHLSWKLRVTIVHKVPPRLRNIDYFCWETFSIAKRENKNQI